MRYVDEALPLHNLYAERHHIPVELVLNNQMLELAAMLEFELSQRRLTVSEARRRFVTEYPQTNCVTPWVYQVDRAGRKFKKKTLCVLRLIKPFDDSLYRIKNLSEL